MRTPRQKLSVCVKLSTVLTLTQHDESLHPWMPFKNPLRILNLECFAFHCYFSVVAVSNYTNAVCVDNNNNNQAIRVYNDRNPILGNQCRWNIFWKPYSCAENVVSRIEVQPWIEQLHSYRASYTANLIENKRHSLHSRAINDYLKLTLCSNASLHRVTYFFTRKTSGSQYLFIPAAKWKPKRSECIWYVQYLRSIDGVFELHCRSKSHSTIVLTTAVTYYIYS